MVSGMETSGSSPKPPKPVITVGARIAAPMTVVSARTEPTERSMPPMRMTNVMPTARIVLMEIWPRMTEKLSVVAK